LTCQNGIQQNASVTDRFNKLRRKNVREKDTFNQIEKDAFNQIEKDTFNQIEKDTFNQIEKKTSK